MGFRDELGGNLLPGVSAEVTMKQRRYKSIEDHQALIPIVIHKDTVDNQNAGNTTELRPGLTLVRIEAGGADQFKWVNPEHAAAPLEAAVIEACILNDFVEMKDRAGVVKDQQADGLIHGVVDDSKLLYGAGTAAPYKVKIRSVLKLVHFQG
jgi:hypothetical protein